MTRVDYIRAWLAKWVMVNICARLHATATVVVCMEVAELINEKYGEMEVAQIKELL